ncbi:MULTISPECIES: DNA repair protein Rad50 [Dictyoglomus]|jgi:hypothetical protein|nr:MULTISPECIES: DNA repair protein Rad50 [Dictyoglomus]
MKDIPQEIIHKVMRDLLERIYLPFSWGKETLFYFYHFQKGEEEKLIKSFNYFKDFQNWMIKNKSKFNKLIRRLNEIKDLRGEILVTLRTTENLNNISLIIDDIKNLICQENIILPEDILIPDMKYLSYENFLWEVLSFYLKMTKFITFAINFDKFPKLSERFKGKKLYKYNTPYKMEEEKSFLQNLILAICGVPGFEEIEFSLLNSISPKRNSLPETLEIKDDIFIFHK